MVRRIVGLVGVALCVVQGGVVSAQQQQPPWTGIATDESRPVDTGVQYGSSGPANHALSADGRFVAFYANSPLLSSDTNDRGDIYVRDRLTGDLALVSVATDGTQGNDYSSDAAISADGRYIAFASMATNLVADDNNGAQDVFVHDRITGTTTLVSIDPNGAAAEFTSQVGIRLSGDGRFVTFVADCGSEIGSGTPLDLFLRDRDPDENGVFDEPGLSTTIQISTTTFGEIENIFAFDAAISRDARYLAYIGSALIPGQAYLGNRVFLYDRLTATTTLVDMPIEGYGDETAYAHSLDLGDGHLAYITNVANLVEDDADALDNVFVYDIAAGTNSIVRLTHPGAPLLAWLGTTVISADGRYVAFDGVEETEFGDQNKVFAADRETGQSYQISVRPDGTSADFGAWPAISADGSAIAFWGSPDVMGNPGVTSGVFVKVAMSLTPAQTTEVPREGGTYTAELTTPANLPWTVEHDENATVTPESGVGPATLQITIGENASGETTTTRVVVGSLVAGFRQIEAATVTSIDPPYGPMSGSTVVWIHGSGFTEASTVTVGGVPATNVYFIYHDFIIATTPAHAFGPVDVVVSDGVSPPGTLAGGFFYHDETPPTITHSVTGTVGLGDWYISDVTVTWTVEDLESPITYQDCIDALTVDSYSENVACYAESDGGGSYDSIEIKRDATPPTVTIQTPQPGVYALNAQVPIAFSCDDETSGVTSCQASQAGTFVNTSAVGTFTFTVTAHDAAGHTTASPVTYTVKAPTSVAVAPASGTYGGNSLLSAMLTSGGAGVAGKTVAFFIDNLAAGTATTDASGAASRVASLAGLNAGSHTLRATFTEDASALGSTATSGLTIAKAPTTVFWNSPSPITYGAELSAVQLNATASTTGSFVYSPPAGAVLSAGTRTLSVTFTPADSANYLGSSKSVSLVVDKATPTITWATPAAISYGTALSATQLNASASVAGTFVYSPVAGTVLGAGTQTLSVTFTPTDTVNYLGASRSVTLAVGKATPSITWATPAAISYGTALSATQLNATASVGGTFAYSPAAGTVFGAGAQTLSVTFMPTDAANYLGASASVALVVNKAATSITWDALSAITYGTALSATQLNATASTAGSFAYSPAAGAVLGAGTQTLSVTFTPTDTANYLGASASVALTVNKATPSITWNAPSAITYGTALSGVQLNATASTAGSFAYSPAAGAVLDAGTQTLSVTFTPADPANYNGASATQSLTVTPAALTVRTNDASKVYGQALPSFSVTGTGFVNGDTIASLGGALSFTTSATATSAPGNYSVTPSGLTSTNYVISLASGTLAIAKSDTSVALSTSPNPSHNNQVVQLTAAVSAVVPGAGTATGTIEFRENGTLLGSASLVNGVATFTKAFKKGTHPLTATYLGSTNFNGSSGGATLTTN